MVKSTEIKISLEAAKIKHEFHMKELEYIRETERLKHEWDKERSRIKSAEIRKSQMRRDAYRG